MAWARVVGPAVTLAIVVWRVGTGPFVDGVRTVDGGALAAAGGLAVLTTVCCAWRWKIVAEGLGVDLPLPAAVAAYYRSQFLNLTLPGGIVGDVHRGISHGRDVRDVGRGCGRSPGNAPPASSCSSSSPPWFSSRCPRPCSRPCRWWRSRWPWRSCGAALVVRARPAGRSAWARPERRRARPA